MQSMGALIVFANPNPQSYCNAILREICQTLHSAGRNYVVRDLYKQKFKAVLDADDISAIRQGAIPTDILNEQKYISEADSILFIYPVWWWGCPAILKGWIDRTFLKGFAFDIGTDNQVVGLLSDKKVMVIAAFGNSEESLDKENAKEVVKRSIIDGTFGFCGVRNITYFPIYGVRDSDIHFRKECLEEINSCFA